MKELKDTVLKKGDIIYYSDNECNIVTYSDEITPFHIKIDKITKIERPVKYETIYEAPKQILTKEEKEYLESVCKPFKDRVKYIRKSTYCGDGFAVERIMFYYMDIHNEYVSFALPMFRKDTIYKEMEFGKEYTLKELGLFE